MDQSRISHYRILHKLGAGGMGEVYLAEDTILNRRVALKVLPREQTEDEDRLRRFKQEAKAASTLNHPNIITIHEVGEADGQHFITTEFVDGETLRSKLVRAGRLKPLEALDVALQITSALSAAHANHIVHRDIKPENVMIRGDGLVKVLDFGLAKLTETAIREPLDTSAPTMAAVVKTQTGVVLGTAQYMSPEQATGQQVDARSDIFSLGLVLYEMLSGHRAFQGGSLVETLAAILHSEPQPLPDIVPTDLAKTVLRCMRKDPARRFQTAADLKVALEDLRDEFSGSPRRVPNRRERRWQWLALAGFLLLAGVVSLFILQTRPTQTVRDPVRAIALTSLQGVELYPSFSPDGNNIAFTWTGPKQNKPDIYVQTIGSGTPHALTTDESSDSNPVWSPDGKWIAFLRGNPAGPFGIGKREVRIVPPLGGPERLVTEISVQEFFPSPVFLAWSADSNAVVVSNSQGASQPDALFAVSLDSGDKKQLTNPQPPALADTNPSISPDGHFLAFRRRVTWSHGELYVMPLGPGLTAAGEPQRLTQLSMAADYPTWMPDSKELLFSARGFLWRLKVDGASEAVRLPFVGEDGSMPVVSRPSSNGNTRLAYVHNASDANIYRIDTNADGLLSSSPPALAIASTKQDIHGHFSPDGRRVAFTSTRSGEWEIWTSDSNGTNATQLTFMHAQATGGPQWSPDGQRLLFASDFEGQFEVYEISASGGQPRRITNHSAFDHAPNYSADGKWIYFCSTRNGPYQLWKLPVTGGQPIQVTTTDAFVSYESKDGSYLYYTESSQTGSPLWRMPAGGGPAFKLLDRIVMWDFAVLEKGIYFADKVNGETRLQFYDFATQTSKTVAHNVGEPAGGISATADGRSILFSRTDSSVDDLMLVEDFK